jgi:hypothetical protein
VSSQYWAEVAEQKQRMAAAHAEAVRKQREAQAAQAELLQNQRDAAALLATERQARYDALPWWRRLPQKERRLFLLGYFVYAVPVVAMLLVDLLFDVNIINNKVDRILIFVPVINLFAYLGAPHVIRTNMLMCSAGLVLVGLIGLVVTRPIDIKDV